MAPIAQDTAATLTTERLLLRPWRESDLAPFADLNADPDVVRHLPKALTVAESDALARLIGEKLAQNGYGFWAVEVVGAQPFIGFVGVTPVRFNAPFVPAVEIGWRLARSAWGRGYATEAAHAALAFAFDRLGLDEVVSFTVPDNTRSRAVMERLGMAHDPADDFDHPSLPAGHRLRRHVLYRIGREQARRTAP